MPCLVRAKTGIYYVVHFAKGKRVWRSTRTRKRSDAQRSLMQPSPLPVSTPPAVGLASAFDDFLRHVEANLSRKTYKLYRLSLGQFLDFTGDVPLHSLTPKIFDEFKNQRLSKCSPSTVNINLRAVKACFACLKRWEMIEKNPCDGLKPARIPEKLPSFLTAAELGNLVDHLRDPWLRPIVLFAAMTGTRLGEVLNLTWDHVDLENRMVLIESSVSYQVKGGKIRSIPLNGTATEVLSGLPERSGLVFRGKRGGKADPNHVSGAFRKAIRQTTLDRRLHFHSLRHTFASQLVQRGVSLYQVQKLLGHSSARVTEVYAHLQNPHMHEVVEAITLGG